MLLTQPNMMVAIHDRSWGYNLSHAQHTKSPANHWVNISSTCHWRDYCVWMCILVSDIQPGIQLFNNIPADVSITSSYVTDWPHQMDLFMSSGFSMNLICELNYNCLHPIHVRKSFQYRPTFRQSSTSRVNHDIIKPPIEYSVSRLHKGLHLPSSFTWQVAEI